MRGEPGMLARALATRVDTLLRAELQTVPVCILDSGIDASHPELFGRVRMTEAVEESEGRVSTAVLDPSLNNDQLGHGTATAGVVARLAPNAELLDIRVMGRQTRLRGEALLAGLERAIKLDARVINISLAVSKRFALPLSRLCDQAYKKGMVVVAAKRNLPLTDQGFPGEFASCVGVESGAFRRPLDILYRPGEIIEYAAQGENVEVPVAGGGWTIQSGASFAAPAVSALCAVLLGGWPGLTPFEIKSMLKRLSESNPVAGPVRQGVGRGC